MLARGLVIAGLLLGALASPALAANTLTLSSGVTSGVTVQGPNDSSAVSVVNCSPIPVGWATPISGTSWISRVTDCSNSATGSYTYTVRFNVPSGATGQQLSGSVMADDSVTVQLNGHQLFSGGGFQSTSSFSTSDTTLFNAGTNTLTFVVPNSVGASGLDFQVTVNASNVDLTSANPNVTTNGEGEGEGRGACVSAAAHGAHGHGNGHAVAAAVHACPFPNGGGPAAAHSDDTDNDSD